MQIKEALMPNQLLLAGTTDNHNNEFGFVQTEFGMIVDPGDDGFYIPVAMNAQLQDGSLLITIEEKCKWAMVLESCSLNGVTAEEQAKKFLSERYQKYAPILIEVLSIIIKQANYSGIELSIHLKPISKITGDHLFELGNIKIKRNIVEEVTSQNYSPSISTYNGLDCFQFYYINLKSPQNIDERDVDIDDKDQKYSTALDNCPNVFTFYDNDSSNDEACFHYVYFEALIDGEVTQFCYKTPKSLVKKGFLPDCYIKAFEKYCEFNGIPFCHMNSIARVLQADYGFSSVFKSLGNTADKQALDKCYKWFHSCISNYVKFYEPQIPDNTIECGFSISPITTI
jgi:hypothetical protein